jgi:hypothetical protein
MVENSEALGTPGVLIRPADLAERFHVSRVEPLSCMFPPFLASLLLEQVPGPHGPAKSNESAHLPDGATAVLAPEWPQFDRLVPAAAPGRAFQQDFCGRPG